MKNKNILLAVCGGIAAYKAADLCSKLVKQGANVKCILTKNALKFVGESTFEALSGNPVYTDIFSKKLNIPHIQLADWANLIIIAPATANQIANAANGFSNCLLSSTLLATKAKIMWCPAMNFNMYSNLATQKNISTLQSFGHYVLPPEEGLMACGSIGKGRFPSTQIIVSFAKNIFIFPNQDLKGKKILVTAGASVQKIDPMRYISNYSSGKMGLEIANAAYFRGAKVLFIHANMQVQPSYFLTCISAINANEMYEAVINNYLSYDFVFMAAAVADYVPTVSKQKIKKAGSLTLNLNRTKDILKAMGENKQNTILVGFAAESENLQSNALKKLNSKNINFIAANMLSVTGKNSTTISLISKNNTHTLQGTKQKVANELLTLVQ